MIRRIRFTLFAMFAVAMLGVATAGIASAAMGLPGFKQTEASTSTAGKGKLAVKGGASISCEKGSGKQSFNSGSTNLGQFTLSFSECTEGGEACKTSADASGIVLTLGEFHLVLLEGSLMKWYILFLPKETVVECPGAAVKLFNVSGSLLGLLKQKSGEATKEFEVKLEVSNGVQSELFYENNAGTKVEASLLTVQEGTGKAKASGLSSEKDLFLFTNNNEIKN